ncbi:MAG TPA: DUF2064 domain-containing protein [Methylomirabilota bacterium]|nr:DUF2064 domain-containing protein [Methylomirabilota bacterium]
MTRPAAVAVMAEDLGERLTRLLDRLLDDGHACAIAMDSDGPTLPAGRVAQAAAALTGGEADVVIGPSDDGGDDLIGVARRHPGLFDGVPWSTAQTREATLARARALGLRVLLRARGFDVDTPADLARLRSALGGRDTPARTAAFLRTPAC